MDNKSDSEVFELKVKTDVIDFELSNKKGNKIVILGHNGKGKTTFSECIRKSNNKDNNLEYALKNIINSYEEKTYVFNCHFVADNIFEDTQTKDIQNLIIGESLIEANKASKEASESFKEISSEVKVITQQINDESNKLTEEIGDWQNYDKKEKADIEKELKELRDAIQSIDEEIPDKLKAYTEIHSPNFQEISQFLQKKLRWN